MKYRTTGAWGAGEGRRLTSAEIDQNFYDLTQRIDAVEADIAAGTNPISMITSTGSSIYIHMTSGAIFGPIVLPVVRWTDTGNWSAGSSYVINDIFTVPGSGIYHVLKDHVSLNEFDADATDGGDPVYNLLIAVPNPAPIINTTAEVVVLTATHANSYLRCAAPAGTLVYIEAGVFDPPTEVHIRQVTTGAVTVSYGDSGTFVNLPAGTDLGTDTYGATITLKLVAENEWDAMGNLRTASGG